MSVTANKRVLSGMRPTGQLHLGHYHGVLKNWIELQHEYDCFFFIADWHALTTVYEETSGITESVFDIVVDWLSVGINPGEASIFIQSRVPEHAELHLLLSMITPISWLERVPSYKDQQEKLREQDLSTYGFLGYPLLQAADILIYRAGFVPVGEDQVAHIEMAREVARRFNYLYGREPGFEEKAKDAARKMGKRNAKLYFEIRRSYQEDGDSEALEKGHAFLESQQNISLGDRERLLGYLEGGGKVILPEPRALLTPEAKMPGLNGDKMSKSYNNTIGLREPPASVERKIRTMQTDPARVRRSDPGDPGKCPVWPFHEVYSATEVKAWAEAGCRSAGIGCLDCKQPIIDAVLKEQAPIRERSEDFLQDPEAVQAIIDEGCEAAREAARDTLEEVRQAMNLVHR
ncbi:MAG: tryptophan--tRNA ligase [Gammaproteobacteria bacterium]|jgi:tryptophanyl-tRNA synthetase|nr:tryptophan--tRNA ligase [Gammaproteobacteria bacterium]